MQHVGIAIVCSLLVPACAGAPDDAATPARIPDAGSQPIDTSVTEPAQAGLSFRFVAEPDLSLDGSDAIYVDDTYYAVITRASFTLKRVRIIGDAATGNGLTSVREFFLDWGDRAQDLMRFPHAPPGIYSRMLGDIDSYRIEGTIGNDTGEKSFVIDESGVDAELSVGLMDLVLEPGMDEVIEVTVALHPLVTAIAWADVDEDDNGALVVDDSARDIDCARASLERAFGKSEEHDERSECDDDSDGGGDGGADGDHPDGGVGDVDAGGKGRDDGGAPTTGS